MYKIQQGKPLPPKGRDKYGLQKMDIGDSFEFPIEGRPLVGAATQYAKRKYGLHFTIREIDAKTAGCWRVEKSGNQANLP